MASKKIAGITIEIGGDTTKLGKALENSEKKSRSLQVELREIQKGLKFDPTNVELLSQKQTVLTQNIEETGKKLDTLKEAEKQVIEQFEKGEVAEDQVRALQREIIKTENVLGDMKSELQETDKELRDLADGTDSAEKHTKEYADSLVEAEKELDDFKEKAGEAYDTVKKGALALGAAAVASAGYAVNLSTEFDKAYNTLQTQTGATTEEMKELDQSMTNIYRNNFGEDMEDIAQSMATVKTQTGLVGDELEATTTNAILLRDTFGFEVNESVRAANSLMNQFGISADEAYTLIAQGAQKGLNQNDDLLDTINEYAVQFKTSGYNAEEMFNMLANGAETGTWSVDKLGDAIKEYNIRASDGTVTAAILENAKAFGLSKAEAENLSKEVENGNVEAYDKLLGKLKEVDDDTQRYQLGVALFGTMWEDLGEETVTALFNTQGEISKTSDALDQINEIKYDDIGSALSGLKRTLETDVIDPIGDELKPVVEEAISYVRDNAPAIKDVISNIVSAVGSFISVIVDNSDIILATIAGIGAGLLAWNVVTMIQGVVSAIKAFTLANEGLTIAQTALNLVMSANPIGLIVTAIAALVAGFIYLWNTSDEFRNFWIGLWDSIKNAVSTAIDWIVNTFNTIVEFVKNNWQSLLLLIANPFVGAFKLLYDNCESFRNFVDNFVNQVKEFFVNAGQNIVSFFTETIPKLVSDIVKWFNELPAKLGYVFGFVLGKITQFGQNAISWVKTEVPKIISQMVNFFKALPGKIWNAIVGAISYIAKWGASIKSKAVSAISSMVSSVISYAKQLPSKIWSAISGAITKVGEWGSKLKTKAVSAIKTLTSGIETNLKSLPKKFLDVGTNIVKGLWDGINNAKGWILDKISGFAGGVIQGAKDALGIHSPSKVFEKEVGENIAKGLVKGIENESKNVAKSAENMANSLIKSINNKKANAKKSASELSSIFVSEAKSRIKLLQDSNKLSEADTVKYWKTVLSHTKKGTSAYQTAYAELVKSQKALNKTILSEAKDRVKKLEESNKITLAGEVGYWTEIRKQFKKGTSEYKEATTQILKAKSSLKSSMKELDTDYKEDVSKIKKHLISDIQSVTDAYNKAVSDRQNQITSSLSLFNAFKPDEMITKQSLTENLQSQVTALREWDDTLDSLSKKKGMDSGLLEDLQDMSVNSLETLKELNSMSEEELRQYVALYRQKEEIALERSEAENEALKKESEKQIKSLIKTANKQLNELEKTYNTQLKKLGVSTADSSKQIGKDIVKGLQKGIESQNASFQSFLSSYFSSIVSTAKSALQIHSPSRIFADIIGANIPAGIAQGVRNNAKVAENAVSDMSADLVNDPATINGLTLNRKINSTFANESAGSAADVLSAIREYGEKLIAASKKAIVLDTGVLVGETIDQIDNRLGTNYTLRERGI